MLAPPGSVVVAPRAEARVGQVEMVAIFSKQIFAVFLSRYADGSPITGANIEAGTDLQSAGLTETDPGVYSTKELLMAPGLNEIAIKFQMGDITKTQSLAVTLPSEAPAPVATQSRIMSSGSIAIAGSVLVISILLSATFLLARKRLPQRALVRAAMGGWRT
jgi:hypothetical protein